MAEKLINPTRMELTRSKGRLETARRGHKLLKDKRDELMRQFMEQVRRTRALRAAAEQELAEVYAALEEAEAACSPKVLAAALLGPRESSVLSVSVQRHLGAALPEVSFAAPTLVRLPYGCAQTDAALDRAFLRLAALLPQLLQLAQSEQRLHGMAREIESARRRVNALEYIVIPETKAAIRRITMKLEEHERGNVVRLMKVKELVLADVVRRRRDMQNL